MKAKNDLTPVNYFSSLNSILSLFTTLRLYWLLFLFFEHAMLFLGSEPLLLLFPLPGVFLLLAWLFYSHFFIHIQHQLLGQTFPGHCSESILRLLRVVRLWSQINSDV